MKSSDCANGPATFAERCARRGGAVVALAICGSLAVIVPSGAAQYATRQAGRPAAREALPTAGAKERVLFGFTGPSGGFPYTSLTYYNGLFYGTTSVGGLTSSNPLWDSGVFAGYGVVFAVKPGPKHYTQTLRYAFKNAPSDGSNPNAGVILDSGGSIYGTTAFGGAFTAGTVFRLAPTGSGYTESLIYSFKGLKKKDGANPYASLLAGADGTLYGTTANGGSSACTGGCGTVFKLTPGASGYTETLIYQFQGKNDGHNPYGNLIVDTSGNLYGTTTFGGTTNDGTAYKLTLGSSGYAESVLYSFVGGTDGSQPLAGLTPGKNGVLYGTTYNGGSTVCGGGCGIAFSLTPSGGTYTEKIIYGFKGGNDGYYPRGGLLSINGNLYGTTFFGGGDACLTTGCGIVYKLTPVKGAFTESIVYDFQGNNDGAQPGADLTLKGNALYGSTYAGGGANCFTDEGPCGTLFQVKL